MNFLIQKVLAQENGGGGQIIGGNPTGPFKIKPPTGIPTDVCVLINNVTDYIILISIPIAGLMILYGAFLILTAAESPKRFESGKKAIYYTIFGLSIVILAKGLVVIITKLIGFSGKGLCS